MKEYNRSAHGESVEEMVLKNMVKEEVLERLTDKQKEVFDLYYCMGYTQTEIAELLGI